MSPGLSHLQLRNQGIGKEEQILEEDKFKTKQQQTLYSGEMAQPEDQSLILRTYTVGGEIPFSIPTSYLWTSVPSLWFVLP